MNRYTYTFDSCGLCGGQFESRTKNVNVSHIENLHTEPIGGKQATEMFIYVPNRNWVFPLSKTASTTHTFTVLRTVLRSFNNDWVKETKIKIEGEKTTTSLLWLFNKFSFAKGNSFSSGKRIENLHSIHSSLSPCLSLSLIIKKWNQFLLYCLLSEHILPSQYLNRCHIKIHYPLCMCN